MKVKDIRTAAVLTALLSFAVTGTQAATRHTKKPHHKPASPAAKRVLPVPATVKAPPSSRTVPATPAPTTPGAVPAAPPAASGGTGDTRTPSTPSGIDGTGVPGPGTQP